LTFHTNNGEWIVVDEENGIADYSIAVRQFLNDPGNHFADGDLKAFQV